MRGVQLVFFLSAYYRGMTEQEDTMKKIALCLLAIATLAACEPNQASEENLNDIPADVENATPEIP